MSVLKNQRTLLSKAVYVGRLHLRITAKCSRPVVEVVNRNKQYVGRLLRLG